MIDTEGQRAIQEVQAALIIAKRFPRDEKAALDMILNACSRVGLAEQAVYNYAKGGSDISGPSIRLAEAIAQRWGNVECRWKEIDRRKDGEGKGISVIQCLAWDMETNTKITREFSVKHWRDTRQGGYAVTDERDIYEMCANQASRRLRACILAVIPGDIVDEAVRQCETTLKTSADNSPETQKKMLIALGEFGVSKEQVEKRIQRRIDAITPAQVVSLKKIFASLRDGMSSVEDWFEKIEKVAGDNPLVKKPEDKQTEPKPEAAQKPEAEEPKVFVDDQEAKLEAMRTLREAIKDAEISEDTFWARAKGNGWVKKTVLPNEFKAEDLVELAKQVQAISDGEKKEVAK